MHEHYDADGRLTGTTVVTHEPLYDDDDRAQALALDDHEQSRCPCGCGQPLTEAADPTRAFVIEEHTCYARRALDRHERAIADKADKANKPKGWADGVSHYISRSFVPERQKRGGSAT